MIFVAGNNGPERLISIVCIQVKFTRTDDYMFLKAPKWQARSML